MRAVYALGCELRALGANVVVAQIPQVSSVKVGLDDYFVAGGEVRRLDVFASAIGFSRAANTGTADGNSSAC